MYRIPTVQFLISVISEGCCGTIIIEAGMVDGC